MEISSWALYALCPCRRKNKPKKECESSMKTESTATDTVSSADQAPQFPVMGQKTPLDSTNEEEEPAQDIEMPPPMAIQDHSFKPEKDAASDDVTTKLASQLSLTPQADAPTTTDLANQIENIVKNRIDLPLEETSCPKTPPESTTDDTVSQEESTTGQEASTELSMGHMLMTADQELSIDDQSTREEEEEDDKTEVKDAEAEKAKYLKKRQFVVQELYDTEKDYVKDLASIIDGYMAYMRDNPLPDDMEGKDKIVFGNIHQIYDWHNETMLAELEKCLANPSKVGSIFIRYERRLYMYVKYCENKPKSEYVVSEYLDTYFEEVRQKLGHRLMLPDLLIKPVQRIMRYQLLLKDILKYTEKAEEDTSELKKALHVMCVVPKAANDMMQVGRLQGFDGKITAQGKLLLQDTLLVSEVSSGGQQKFKERRVFLFEQIIIFSEQIESKKGNFCNATYIYKNSLKVNKMSLCDKVEGEPLRFQLTDKTPGSDVRMIIQANSEENKETWVKQIRSILDMQGDFLRALQSPIAYQKELTKELSAPNFNKPCSGESLLRKTKSHPLNKVYNLGSSKSVTLKTESGITGTGFTSKNDRCRSVPDPLPQSTTELSAERTREHSLHKASCPCSPAESRKDFLHNSDEGKPRKFSSPLVDATSSPKPKKTIFEGFRNTLSRKSKSSDLTTRKSPADPVNSLSQSPTHTSRTSDASTPPQVVGGGAATSELSEETLLSSLSSSTITSALLSSPPSSSSARISGHNCNS